MGHKMIGTAPGADRDRHAADDGIYGVLAFAICRSQLAVRSHGQPARAGLVVATPPAVATGAGIGRRSGYGMCSAMGGGSIYDLVAVLHSVLIVLVGALAPPPCGARHINPVELLGRPDHRCPRR
jgi:hypothetical protein